MKKGIFWAFLLSMALVFSGAQLASADTLQVDFTGEYNNNNFLNWPFGSPQDRVDWINNIPQEFVCTTHRINLYGGDPVDGNGGWEITSFLNLQNGAREWIFQAGQDILDYEVFYDEANLVAGDLNYFSQVKTSPGYLHFYDGIITDDLYFGIRLTPLDGDEPFGWEGDVDIHPTPIPGALLLLGSGFVGLVGFRRFHRK